MTTRRPTEGEMRDKLKRECTNVGDKCDLHINAQREDLAALRAERDRPRFFGEWIPLGASVVLFGSFCYGLLRNAPPSFLFATGFIGSISATKALVSKRSRHAVTDYDREDSIRGYAELKNNVCAYRDSGEIHTAAMNKVLDDVERFNRRLIALNRASPLETAGLPQRISDEEIALDNVYRI